MTINNYFSYSKVNLDLKVLNKRADGYHNIYSLFLEINLADEIIFVPSSKFNLTADYNKKWNLPLDQNNLIAKSYVLIRSKMNSVPTEYSIHLKKNIPLGSGLGGASSNAAVVLKVLNKFWNLNLSYNKLKKLGARLGADVPFFINGGFQLAEGIGDILVPQNTSLTKGLLVLLVIPQINISTSWAYKKLNKTLQTTKRRPKFSTLSNPMDWRLFDNDFERVIVKTYPEIKHIKQNLINCGALYAGLSGSGSTMFGIFNNLTKAERILDNFPKYKTFLTSPVIR